MVQVFTGSFKINLTLNLNDAPYIKAKQSLVGSLYNMCFISPALL